MKNILPGVKLTRISKSFGSIRAVKSVDISLFPGDIYALIGPNGSGKTTLIKIAVGLLAPDTGTVDFFGHEIRVEPLAAKSSFGYISDGPLGYDHLTGNEFLALAGSLKGLSRSETTSRLARLRKLFPIKEVLNQPMAHYSRGNLQKVAFIAALLGSPKVLIIDEPVVGLDPTSVSVFGQEIKDFAASGGIVFFVTHTLSFAEVYANRFGILDRGVLVGEGKVRPHMDLSSIYQHKVSHD